MISFKYFIASSLILYTDLSCASHPTGEIQVSSPSDLSLDAKVAKRIAEIKLCFKPDVPRIQASMSRLKWYRDAIDHREPSNWERIYLSDLPECIKKVAWETQVELAHIALAAIVVTYYINQKIEPFINEEGKVMREKLEKMRPVVELRLPPLEKPTYFDLVYQTLPTTG